MSPAMPLMEQRAIPEGPIEPGPWRADSAIGLAGDLDPASPPVKQDRLVDGSVPPVEFGLDAAPPIPTPTLSVPIPDAPPSTPARASSGAASRQAYEVQDSNHHVRQFIDHFQTGYRRAVVEAWLSRSGRYLPMILDVFRQKGLPDELVFTAMIESGFNPVAVSRAGAKGLWQFMAPTARRYGLRIDDWLDERLDPEKSTIAAARHLLDLYAVFGSWYLVQAAYNAGEVKVLEAIRAMGTSDFWTLRSGAVLRDETKNFVPAIQAATLIAREPERYGFAVNPSEPLSYDIVTVPRRTGLAWLAGRAGISTETLERLNPELRIKQTPPDKPYPLKVPVGAAGRVHAAVDRESSVRLVAATPRATELHRGKAPPVAVHVVKPRETAGAIARRYGISVADLFRWNDLNGSARIRPGDRLRVAASRREEGQGGFR